MTKLEKLFPKAYATELLAIAEGDLESAKGLHEVARGRKENILYHVQQACEKALKAALVHKGVNVPLVHDLGALIAKLPEQLERSFDYEVIALNPYESIRRYEEGRVQLEDFEIEEGIRLGDTILKWVRVQLQS